MSPAITLPGNAGPEVLTLASAQHGMRLPAWSRPTAIPGLCRNCPA
ncbi:hypothetical protein ACFU5O_32430 [Streptomyces sp. NPDC057445]